MQGGGAEPEQGLTVQGRGIAHMTLQAIAGKAGGQAVDHQPVAGLLGKHAGGGNRRGETIPLHQGALGAAPAAQGQDPIHNHQGRAAGQFLQGAQHRLFGGSSDAQAVDFGSRGLAQGPSRGLGRDRRHQGSPAPGRLTGLGFVLFALSSLFEPRKA